MRNIIAILLLSLLTISSAYALKPNAIVYKNPYCEFRGGCPLIEMYNRTNTKIIARYQPAASKFCTSGSMAQWRIGHPNNAYGIGFTAEDWQDLEVAKAKTKGNWRWGDCCSSDTYDYICLY